MHIFNTLFLYPKLEKLKNPKIGLIMINLGIFYDFYNDTLDFLDKLISKKIDLYNNMQSYIKLKNNIFIDFNYNFSFNENNKNKYLILKINIKNIKKIDE